MGADLQETFDDEMFRKTDEVSELEQQMSLLKTNMALMRKIALAKDRIEEMKAEVGHVRGALVSHRLNRARMCTHTFSTTTCESRLVAKRWT